MIVKARSLRRRPTEILYAGESTQNIGEQTVGETTGYRGIGDCWTQSPKEIPTEICCWSITYEGAMHLYKLSEDMKTSG